MSLGDLPKGYSVRFYEPRDREAVLEQERRQTAKWAAQGTDIALSDPDDPLLAATVVVVDEHDKPVMTIAAKRIVEVGTSFVSDDLSMPEVFSCLARAWGKLAVTLYRRGYDSAICRMVSPTPAWGNALVKRAHWSFVNSPCYYFDLKRELSGVKKNGD